MTTNLIQIENRHGKLKLNDGVHKESADKLIEELETLYGPAAVAAQMRIGDVVCAADDALESVEVEINSPGGSVFEGQRIYNALRGMSARGVEVTTTVNGLAASMGSVILMAGDKRQMTHGSRIMIHEASTIAWGDARTMRKNADLLEGISSEIAGIYAERTGGDLKAIRNLMFAETWMTADEAKDAGFVDTVMKDGKAKAAFDTKAKGDMSILAKLFPGNDEVAKLEAAISEAESLRTDLEAAQARVGELTPLADANIALKAELNEVSAKLAESERIANEAAEKIAELEASAGKLDELAAIKAAELLATQGHPAPVSLVGDNADNKGSLYDQYRELKKSDPRAAAKFWDCNKESMIAGI
jgi:ATP-dependent Clp endopeptidase proteolytic subunit ClpP